MSAASGCVIINALFRQDSFYIKCKECKIGKTCGSYPVGLVNTKSINGGVCLEVICQFTLQWRNDTTAQDHHDQESRSLCCVFTQSGNSQAEDTGPHDRAT